LGTAKIHAAREVNEMNVSTPNTLTFLLLGIGGAGIGALIHFWGTPSTPESQAFVTSPEFVTWFFLNDLLFAAYPIVVVLLWEPLSRLRKYIRPKFWELLGSSLILFVLFLFPHLVGTPIIKLQPLPLEHASIKMLVLMMFGYFGSALPLTVGIWLTHAAIRDAFGTAAQSEDHIKEYIRLREYLKQFLAAFGGLLSIFTLTSAALRTAALAAGATQPSDYPAVLVLVLGVYYTLLIAVVYFPAHLALATAGQRLLNIYFALPSPDAVGWAEKYAGRKQLRELLELEMSGTQRLATSLTLLAPFVSGIFSLLVGV
jgi:hypothetical protein